MADHSINLPKTISRRDFLKITAIAGLTVGLGASVGKKFLLPDNLHRSTSTHYLMGTIVNFNILAPDQASGQEAIQKTIAEMERLIAIFNYRQAGTALSKLNQAGALNDAPVELVEIIKQSLDLGIRSHGAFDITVLPIVEAFKAGQTDIAHLKSLVDFRNVIVNDNHIEFVRPGMSITLDGIAKGRVVDGGVATLKNMGYENVLVEAGGDMMAASSKAAGEEWTVAVNNPRPANGTTFIASFSVKNKAVTTSGDYLNYYTPDFSRYHIIDPRTGVSPTELSSATVIASSAAEADSLSTTLMVLGVHNGLEFIEQIPGVEALLVTRDLAVYKTAGFPIN